jgi:hypothetical protein
MFKWNSTPLKVTPHQEIKVKTKNRAIELFFFEGTAQLNSFFFEGTEQLNSFFFSEGTAQLNSLQQARNPKIFL